MSTNILTPAASYPRIAIFRRRLLRVHSVILALVALASAVYSTTARATGIGPYGFLQQNPMVWVGLIQAYLLMAVIAMTLWFGSGQAKARKWNVVAVLAHCAPLLAVIFSWGLLNSLGFGPIAIFSLVFHSLWICLETIMALYPDPANHYQN